MLCPHGRGGRVCNGGNRVGGRRAARRSSCPTPTCSAIRSPTAGCELLHRRAGRARPTRARQDDGHPAAAPVGQPAGAGRLRRRPARQVTLPAPDGRYGAGSERPAHPRGAARAAALGARSRPERRTAISARLDWSAPELLELFPFAHELRLDALAGDAGLELVTTLRADRRRHGPGVVRLSPVPVPARRRAAGRLAGVAGRVGAARARRPDDPDGRQPSPLSPAALRLDDQSWDDGLAGLASPPEFSVSRGRADA